MREPEYWPMKEGPDVYSNLLKEWSMELGLNETEAKEFAISVEKSNIQEEENG